MCLKRASSWFQINQQAGRCKWLPDMEPAAWRQDLHSTTDRRPAGPHQHSYTSLSLSVSPLLSQCNPVHSRLNLSWSVYLFFPLYPSPFLSQFTVCLFLFLFWPIIPHMFQTKDAQLKGCRYTFIGYLVNTNMSMKENCNCTNSSRIALFFVSFRWREVKSNNLFMPSLTLSSRLQHS